MYCCFFALFSFPFSLSRTFFFCCFCSSWKPFPKKTTNNGSWIDWTQISKSRTFVKSTHVLRVQIIKRKYKVQRCTRWKKWAIWMVWLFVLLYFFVPFAVLYLLRFGAFLTILFCPTYVSFFFFFAFLLCSVPFMDFLLSLCCCTFVLSISLYFSLRCTFTSMFVLFLVVRRMAELMYMPTREDTQKYTWVDITYQTRFNDFVSRVVQRFGAKNSESKSTSTMESTSINESTANVLQMLNQPSIPPSEIIANLEKVWIVFFLNFAFFALHFFFLFFSLSYCVFVCPPFWFWTCSLCLFEKFIYLSIFELCFIFCTLYFFVLLCFCTLVLPWCEFPHESRRWSVLFTTLQTRFWVGFFFVLKFFFLVCVSLFVCVCVLCVCPFVLLFVFWLFGVVVFLCLDCLDFNVNVCVLLTSFLSVCLSFLCLYFCFSFELSLFSFP